MEGNFYSMFCGIRLFILFIRRESGFGGGGRSYHDGGGGGYTGGNGSDTWANCGGGGGSFNADKNGTATLGWFDEGNVEVKFVKK